MFVKCGIDVLNLYLRSHAEHVYMCVCVCAFKINYSLKLYVFIWLQTKVKIKFFTDNLFSTLAKKVS